MALPTNESLQKTQRNMDSIDEFVSSSDPSLNDQYGDVRKTLTGIETDANNQLANLEQEFQNRFAPSATILPWEPLTLIESALQRYSTGTIGESGYKEWLADPAKVPFTTGATFTEDEALDRWIVVETVTSGILNTTVDENKPFGKPLTLQQARTSDIAKEGDTVIISDRGNGLFEYKTGQVATGNGIIACTGVPTLSLVIIDEYDTTPIQYGATGDDVADDSEVLTEFAGVVPLGQGRLLDGGTFNCPTGDFSGVNFYAHGGSTITNNTTAIVNDLTKTNIPIQIAPSTVYKKGQLLKHTTDFFEYTFQVVVGVATYTNSIIELLKAGSVKVVAQIPLAGKKYAYPAGWAGLTPDVYSREDGEFFLSAYGDPEFRIAYSVDANNVKAKGGAAYYVTTSGDDTTGDGLTEATAWRTINKALAAPDVLTIFLKGGTGEEAGYVMTSGLESSVNIIGYGDGKAVIFNPRPSLFVADATPNVWVKTDSSPHGKPCSLQVKDENGLPTGYTRVDTVAEVGQVPLSYTNVGNSLYVHATSEPIVGVDLYATLKTFGNSIFTTAANTEDVTVYCENILWPNVVRSLCDDTGALLVALNCAAISGDDIAGFNCWTISGHDSILHKCIAAYTELDGFNYTYNNQIESACTAYSVGLKGTGSNQASTSHVTANTLRIGCNLESANQNSILDVGEGVTINLGVKTRTLRPVFDCIQTNNTRDMYNHYCVTSGDDDHYDNAGTGTMYIDGNLVGQTFGGSGVIKLHGE